MVEEEKFNAITFSYTQCFSDDPETSSYECIQKFYENISLLNIYYKFIDEEFRYTPTRNGAIDHPNRFYVLTGEEEID